MDQQGPLALCCNVRTVLSDEWAHLKFCHSSTSSQILTLESWVLCHMGNTIPGVIPLVEVCLRSSCPACPTTNYRECNTRFSSKLRAYKWLNPCSFLIPPALFLALTGVARCADLQAPLTAVWIRFPVVIYARHHFIPQLTTANSFCNRSTDRSQSLNTLPHACCLVSVLQGYLSWFNISTVGARSSRSYLLGFCCCYCSAVIFCIFSILFWTFEIVRVYVINLLHWLVISFWKMFPSHASIFVQLVILMMWCHLLVFGCIAR